jgi:hypothetical protein
MFSGFLGDVLDTFEAATGSDHYDRPGALTFVWKDGRTFAHDHHSIAVRQRHLGTVHGALRRGRMPMASSACR